MGDEIVAKFGGYRGRCGANNPWFAATVAAVDANGTAAVDYFDGDKCSDITADEILFCPGRAGNYRRANPPPGAQPVWFGEQDKAAGNGIIIYGREECPNCHYFKSECHDAGVLYKTVDCDDPAGGKEMWDKLATAEWYSQGTAIGLPIIDAQGTVLMFEGADTIDEVLAALGESPNPGRRHLQS